MNRKTQRLADVSLSAEEIREEADYVNAPADSVEEKETMADRKCSSYTRSFAQLAVCWLILLVIIGLRIYFTAVISESANNNQQLKTLELKIQKLSSENENLRRNHDSLTVRFDNLTQAYAVLESNITNLTAKNSNLTMKNQELEMSKNDLTEQIQTMKTNWNKLNTSRAQWSIDVYCPGSEGSGKRQCKPCQNGWDKFESNCYAINNPKRDNLRTWEEAQEDCRGKNSDLVVVVSEAEKKYVNAHSWPEGDLNQYWIGLRAEDNKWKWVDGTDLTNNSWIQQTPSDGLCAVSIQNEGWKAVSCSQKNRWLCQMKALSV